MEGTGQAGTTAWEQGHLADLCLEKRAQDWPHTSQALTSCKALAGWVLTIWDSLQALELGLPSFPVQLQQANEVAAAGQGTKHRVSSPAPSERNARLGEPGAHPSSSQPTPTLGSSCRLLMSACGGGSRHSPPERGAPRGPARPCPSCSPRLPGPFKRMNHPCCCQLRARHQDSPPTLPEDGSRLRGEPCCIPALGWSVAHPTPELPHLDYICKVSVPSKVTFTKSGWTGIWGGSFPICQMEMEGSTDHCLGHRGDRISDTKCDPEQSFPRGAHVQWVPSRQILPSPCILVAAAMCPPGPTSPPLPNPTSSDALHKHPEAQPRRLRAAPVSPPPQGEPAAQRDPPPPGPATVGRNPLPVPPRGSRRLGKGPLAVAIPDPCSEPGHSTRTHGDHVRRGHLVLRHRVQGPAWLQAAPARLRVPCTQD